MNEKQRAELYRKQMGDEAYARNLIAGVNRYPCCFNYRSEDHHPDCRNHPAKRASKAYRTYFGDGVS